MSDYKPITGELRNVYTQTDAYNTVFHTDEFERCCDAIDAIHAGLEREYAALEAELDRVLGEKEKHVHMRGESITDELRKYAQSWRETPSLMDDLDAGDVDSILTDFEHIADRIDAEHERQLEVLYRDISDAEYVKLHKDTGGEYIHEHDKVDWRDHAGTWHENATVVALCNDGCYVMDGTVFHVHKSDIRHRHAPTVEDVLREFAHDGICIVAKREFKAGELDFYADEEAIAEYAKRLQLASEDK